MKNKLIILIITALAIVLAGCGTSTSKILRKTKTVNLKQLLINLKLDPLKYPLILKELLFYQVLLAMY